MIVRQTVVWCWSSEMSDKHWGSHLMREGNANSTLFYLKGKGCIFCFQVWRQLKYVLKSSSIAEGWFRYFVQSLYFRSILIPISLASLSSDQGEYMSQQLHRSRWMSCWELHWFSVLRVRRQLEGASMWRPILLGWLWVPWKRSLPGQDLHLQDRMARWADVFGCQRPQHYFWGVWGGGVE